MQKKESFPVFLLNLSPEEIVGEYSENFLTADKA